VTLHEGRNREVRRLFEHEGFEVSKLSRIRYGNVLLPADLRACGSLALGAAMVSELMRLAGTRSPAVAG
jgi:23S rRNA pseudouridine2605 synthase